jgi:DNA polymerase elongation subunit (family B)
MSSTSFNFFPFSWHYSDEDVNNNKICVIKIFGWNENNESVCIKIRDFLIPVWVELPGNHEWTENKRAIVANFLRNYNTSESYKPVTIQYKLKKKLYNADINLNETTNKYEKKLHPFLECTFRSLKSLESFLYFCKDSKVLKEFGQQPLKFICHASSKQINPVLKFMAVHQLSSASWLRARGKSLPLSEKETSKKFEYLVSCKEIMKHPCASSLPIVYPKIMAWDIETYSMDENSMPNPEKSEDAVFLISCVFSEYIYNQTTKLKEKKITKYCLSCVDVDENKVESDTIVIKYQKELELLIGFSNFIRKQDPDILVGFNILNYDLNYLIARAQFYSCFSSFAKLGCTSTKVGNIIPISWGSSARGKQNMQYIEAEGRMWFDLLPYIRMNYQFTNYKLKTCCSEILKTDNKDDLDIKDMFKYYRTGDKTGLAIALNYCTQDSNVLLKLWDKCLIWFDITETATTCCIPPFYIIEKAQQIRIVSQMLNYCIHNNIVLETNIHKTPEGLQYEGATVKEPIPGLYKNVVPFDFASLYPTIIMAYNIDYSTIVTDENIPDNVCHLLEWETHMSCSCPKSDGTKPKKNKKGELKIICGKFRLRWLKEMDTTYKGVIPTLIKNLIDARKNTRLKIEEYKNEIKKLKAIDGINQNSETNKKISELYEMCDVLDKRQLAFKVSANSMYGIMGASEGYLPFLNGAMSVTYVGRKSIRAASEYIEKEHKGKVIYNDTDSAYTIFPHMDDKPMQELWDYANMVVDDIAKLFLKPMKLEFEGKVYTRFLIFSKKRYVGLQANEKGIVSDKWKISGIVLKRRDNCKVLKELYENMIDFVLKNTERINTNKNVSYLNNLIQQYDKLKKGATLKIRSSNKQLDETLNNLNNQIHQLEVNCRNHPAIKELMDIAQKYIDEMFLLEKYKPIDFVITKTITKEVYAAKTPPPHVAVVNKMKQRNIIVQVNERVEYVLTECGVKPGIKETQDQKAEDFGYQQEHEDWLRVDRLFYLEKQLIIPVNQIFEVACGVHNFMDELYELRLQKKKIIHQIDNLSKPLLKFE